MTVYEVVIEGRQGVDDMLNVIHYDDLGTPPGDWADVASVVAGHLTDHLISLCSSWVTWTGLTYRIDSPGEVGVFVPFSGGPLVGTDVSGDQLNQVALLVRKRSSGSVRPVLGWIFQGGLTAHGLTTQGLWEPAIRDEMGLMWEDLRVLNIAGPSTLQMVIKASNPTAPNTQPYSAVNLVEPILSPSTLRRRKRGVGS